MKNNERLKSFLFGILLSLFMWVFVTNIIQTLKCPRMTQTELFLSIPNSFLLRWNENCGEEVELKFTANPSKFNNRI